MVHRDDEDVKLAIVGSVRLAGNAEARGIIERVLEQYQPTLVISGGADGIDTMAVEAAKRRGIPYREFLPAFKNWPAYKERNLLIAMECDRLVRIVSVYSKTYGSGWTRDRAVEMGKPTDEYQVDDVVKET